MATNTSPLMLRPTIPRAKDDAPADRWALATREGARWRELITDGTRRACESMREALGLRSSRLYRAGRVLRDKLPHSRAPSRDYPPVDVARYIAWLNADPSRVAYVYPWTPNRRSASDDVRKLLEKRGPVVEVDPTEYTEETEP